MTKTIRKYLVVLLSPTPLNHGPRGIEFSPPGREIFRAFVVREPMEFLIRWNGKIFLKRGTHDIRKDNGCMMIISRYVQVEFCDLDLIDFDLICNEKLE